jgi:hypothetical protein
MDEDIKLLRLFILLLQGPKTIKEIMCAVQVDRRAAYWYLKRLQNIAPFIPGMPRLSKVIRGIYVLSPPSEWGAYWYLRRLKSITPYVPGMPELKNDAERGTWQLESGKLSIAKQKDANRFFYEDEKGGMINDIQKFRIPQSTFRNQK